MIFRIEEHPVDSDETEYIIKDDDNEIWAVCYDKSKAAVILGLLTVSRDRFDKRNQSNQTLIDTARG